MIWNTASTVIYNGRTVNSVYYNGIKIWPSAPPTPVYSWSASGYNSAYAFNDKSKNVVGYYPPSFTLNADSPLAKAMPIYSASASSNGFGPTHMVWSSSMQYGFDPDIIVTDAYLTASASISLRRWDTSKTASAEYYAQFLPLVRMLKDASGSYSTASQYVTGLSESAIGMEAKMSSFTTNYWRRVDSVYFTASAASARIYNRTATASRGATNYLLPIFAESIKNCDMGYTLEWGLSGNYRRQQ